MCHFKQQNEIFIGLWKDSCVTDRPHTFLPTQVPDCDKNQLALTDNGSRAKRRWMEQVKNNIVIMTCCTWGNKGQQTSSDWHDKIIHVHWKIKVTAMPQKSNLLSPRTSHSKFLYEPFIYYVYLVHKNTIVPTTETFLLKSPYLEGALFKVCK